MGWWEGGGDGREGGWGMDVKHGKTMIESYQYTVELGSGLAYWEDEAEEGGRNIRQAGTCGETEERVGKSGTN